MTNRRKGKDDANQLQIDWTARVATGPTEPPSLDASSAPPQPVQRLPWDFTTTFPAPTYEAIDAGIIGDEDAAPGSFRAIHDEHARELLAVLRDLDIVRDARRLGVDPKTGRAPRTPASRQRLATWFANEPERLSRWWDNLIGVYAEVFGTDTADAFGMALRARHAGIEVVAEIDANAQSVAAPPLRAPIVEQHDTQGPTPRAGGKRISARLPVPKPLASAIAAGHFGHEDDGTPVKPGPNEVRAITEQHARALIDLLEAMRAASRSSAPGEAKRLSAQFEDAIRSYAEDLGMDAAQLQAYVGRQVAPSPSGHTRSSHRR